MKSEIPKLIHYCWFGGNPLPPVALKCIESWQKFLPDYKIIRWDESNYDVNKIAYIKKAYELKKYAFVSDYVRFDILYTYGGLYFDTDVEVIASLDKIIAEGSFMGCENPYKKGASPLALCVNSGLGLGACPHQTLYKDILDMYSELEFNPDELITVVRYVTSLLSDKGLKNLPTVQNVEGINIYPNDYFCPMDYSNGKLKISSNTKTIHHYTASWFSPRQRKELDIYRKLNFFPESIKCNLSELIAEYQINGIKAVVKLLVGKIAKNMKK